MDSLASKMHAIFDLQLPFKQWIAPYPLFVFYILAHGDDFFIVGGQEEREYALSLLRGAYELSKVVTFCPGSSQSRTASFLGRTLTLRQVKSSANQTSSMFPAH